MLKLFALSDADRLREEDPFTGHWTSIAPTRLIGLLVLTACSPQPPDTQAPIPDARPDILVIVLDDLGVVDKLIEQGIVSATSGTMFLSTAMGDAEEAHLTAGFEAAPEKMALSTARPKPSRAMG